LGRFINKDPIEEQGGLNLYGFCRNNGVNRWDYLGLDPDGETPFNFGGALDTLLNWGRPQPGGDGPAPRLVAGTQVAGVYATAAENAAAAARAEAQYVLTHPGSVGARRLAGGLIILGGVALINPPSGAGGAIVMGLAGAYGVVEVTVGAISTTAAAFGNLDAARKVQETPGHLVEQLGYGLSQSTNNPNYHNVSKVVTSAVDINSAVSRIANASNALDQILGFVEYGKAVADAAKAMKDLAGGSGVNTLGATGKPGSIPGATWITDEDAIEQMLKSSEGIDALPMLQETPR
jgi:hypothetical protein